MTWLCAWAADALVLVGAVLSYAFGAGTRCPPLAWLGAALMLACLVVALVIDPRTFARESFDARAARWRAWGMTE